MEETFSSMIKINSEIIAGVPLCLWEYFFFVAGILNSIWGVILVPDFLIVAI